MSVKTNDGWREHLIGALGRLGLILLVMTVLLVVSLFPLTLGGYAEIRPAFILMAIYYWAIARPGIFTLPRVFILGIVFDLLAGFPLGLNTAIFVLAYWVTSTQRKFLLGQGFFVVWAAFAAVAAGNTFLQVLFFSAFSLSIVVPKAALVSLFFTCLLFPLVVPVLSAFGRWLSAKASLLA
jgi:rod shape-determining protein MreD